MQFEGKDELGLYRIVKKYGQGVDNKREVIEVVKTGAVT